MIFISSGQLSSASSVRTNCLGRFRSIDSRAFTARSVASQRGTTRGASSSGTSYSAAPTVSSSSASFSSRELQREA